MNLVKLSRYLNVNILKWMINYCRVLIISPFIFDVFFCAKNGGFDKIFYDSKWYNVKTTNYQQFILMMICRKQNGVKISVGPFGNINRELIKQVCSSIHQRNVFRLFFPKIFISNFSDYKQSLLFRYVFIEFCSISSNVAQSITGFTFLKYIKNELITLTSTYILYVYRRIVMNANAQK